MTCSEDVEEDSEEKNEVLSWTVDNRSITKRKERMVAALRLTSTLWFSILCEIKSVLGRQKSRRGKLGRWLEKFILAQDRTATSPPKKWISRINDFCIFLNCRKFREDNKTQLKRTTWFCFCFEKFTSLEPNLPDDGGECPPTIWLWCRMSGKNHDNKQKSRKHDRQMRGDTRLLCPGLASLHRVLVLTLKRVSTIRKTDLSVQTQQLDKTFFSIH